MILTKHEEMVMMHCGKMYSINLTKFIGRSFHTLSMIMYLYIYWAESFFFPTFRTMLKPNLYQQQ